MPTPIIPSEIRERVRSLLPQLTLEEKASLLVGRDFWSTQPIERLGIPSIVVTDGPTGVRRAPETGGIGLGDSIPATCYATSSLQAATWNTDLIQEVGAAIGREARALNVQILLGPGVNLKRSPLTGRNFEYMSEDPVLSGEMAAAFINGVQSEGVGTSIKHFVANENETGRMLVDAIVDERTLRELYLRSFEIAIDKAHPWTVMCAYNRLNGPYCAENHELLTDILKGDWGYEGIVMSDWGAVNDRAQGVEAGLHLQMPYAPTASEIVGAVNAGDLALERLDSIVSEMLAITLLAAESSQASDSNYVPSESQALARKLAEEGMVLLKNDGNLLPIVPDTGGKIALIGEFARTPRFQGSGSSQVIPTRVTTLLEELPIALPTATIKFLPGYGLTEEPGSSAIVEAAKLASESNVAVVVVGLPTSFETEGYDRTHLNLPESHNDLVRAVLDAQPNTVIVLINGTAVALPWVDEAPAILEAWLGGQEAATAIAAILTGAINPSGKLSESFPVRIEDTAAFGHFPTEGDGTARFSEGIFTGYRWHDSRQIAPLFPFGHGLSYTTFEFDGLTVSASDFEAHDTVEIAVTVENTGSLTGQEVVQLYVTECNPVVPRPVRELKAFAKVNLAPGEETCVQFTLDWRELGYWDSVAGGWVMQPGDYEFSVGASSRDIRLSAQEFLHSAHVPELIIDRLTPLSVAIEHQGAGPMLRPQLANIPPDFMAFLNGMPLGKFLAMGGPISSEEIDVFLEAANA